MILFAKFKEISGSFILGKLAQNLKRTSSKVKTHLYAIDPEDCLTFNYEFTGTAQVEKHLVTGTVWEMQFTQTKIFISIQTNYYTKNVSSVQGALKKEELEKELEEEQHPRFRTTSSGRILN